MLKNKYIRNSLIILVVTLSLLLMDLLLKHYLYDQTFADKYKGNFGNGHNSVRQWDITAIAGRSYLHKSSTFLDFIGGSIPNWAGLLINYSIASLFLAIGFINKSKGVVIGAAITLAGILGNTMDSTFLPGVRDIFFLPYWDKGTFNFADCIVVIGAATTAISFLVSAFKKA